MLSVVIATRNAMEYIEPCLAALEPQIRDDTEVVVADGSRDGTAERIEQAFPWARLVRGSARDSLGELRATALANTHGDIVAFTDVYCRVSPGWMDRLRQEPWHMYAAIGGAVVPVPRRRLSEWAAFLCEYGPFLPPVPAGQASNLSGNNIAFRRDALERAGLIGEREFWKVFALWRLRALGERFGTDPGLLVHHSRTTHLTEFTYHRYLHGRCFGARRAATRSWLYKCARAGSCPALPLLLTVRLVRAVHGNQSYRRVLWQSMPFAVLYHAAWAWGELLGYLRGSADTCSQLA